MAKRKTTRRKNNVKSSVPFNDTARMFSLHEELLVQCLRDVGNGGRWLNGPMTQAFARQFAGFCGCRFCIPVGNGSDALELAIRAVVGPDADRDGAEVITVANAGGYTTTACRIAGATPVYVDIVEDTLLMDVDSVVSVMGSRVKAVVATHLYGGAVDVERLRRALDSHGYAHVPIIEDCAQAHGAKVGDRRVGGLGRLATFSFYPTKNLGTIGDAGAIVTSDETLYRTLKALHQYGWRERYHVALPYGRNSRMDEFHAAALGALLPNLDAWNRRRKDVYESYRSTGRGRVRYLNHGSGDYVAHLAVVMVEDRDGFIRHMDSRGIGTDIHYPILDCDQAGWSALPMRIADDGLHTTRRCGAGILSLPCFPTMTDSEVEQVCEALNEWEER